MLVSPYFLSIKSLDYGWDYWLNDRVCWKQKFKDIQVYFETTLSIIDNHIH